MLIVLYGQLSTLDYSISHGRKKKIIWLQYCRQWKLFFIPSDKI